MQRAGNMSDATHILQACSPGVACNVESSQQSYACCSSLTWPLRHLPGNRPQLVLFASSQPVGRIIGRHACSLRKKRRWGCQGTKCAIDACRVTLFAHGRAGLQAGASRAAGGRAAGGKALGAAGRGAKRPSSAPESPTHAAHAKALMLGGRVRATPALSAGEAQ